MKQYHAFYADQIRSLRLNIKYYRKNAGLTQQELAERAGLSASYVSRLEAPRSRTVPSLDSIHLLAYSLNVRPADFFKTDD